MKRRIIILYLLVLVPIMAMSQFSGERAVQNDLEKGRWDKAYQHLQKLIHKDSLQPAAHHLLAQYFFTPANPGFQIDSAYREILLATKQFKQATPRQRERAKRFSTDSLSLLAYREKIDSGAFARATQLNTTVAYDFFLNHFTLASQQQQAVELRDEVAFQDAMKENSYQAFEEYLSLYPASKRSSDARTYYERLLYETKTKDQRLTSYESFLKTFPNTPYRGAVEEKILKISTASGDPRSFENFLEKYPQSPHGTLAKKILFHLLADESGNPHWPEAVLNDSTKKVLESRDQFLVPFLHADHFGFMDSEGNEVIPARITEIAKEYRCGNITEDVLVLPEGIVNRLGSRIYPGVVSDLEDMGNGFLLVEDEGCARVVHKSGFIPLDSCVDDAKVINESLLAIKHDGHWGLVTLLGLPLQPYRWDDVQVMGSVVILKEGNKLFPSLVDSLSRAADQHPPALHDSFDELKSWPGKLIWARAGNYQGLLDSTLNFYIPFEKYSLTPAFFGYLATEDGRTKVFFKQQDKGSFRQVIASKPWLAVTAQGGWQLSRPMEPRFKSVSLDSVFFVGSFAIGVNPDTLLAFVEGGKKFFVKPPARFEFIPGVDSTSFLLLDQDGKKTVFDQKGKKLFVMEADKIQHAGDKFFLFQKKEKKGLVGPDGKVWLPAEYDALGQLKDGTVSLLKAMKFGLFQVRSKKLIKPEYLKNLVVYNPESIVAYKEGSYGFIDWQNKPKGESGFSEVRNWNDTLAMVKKNGLWMLYDVVSGKVAMEKIRNFKFIRDTPTEKLAIVQQENRYGVIHNTKGTVIPITFSDIVNVGPPEDPVYFTEKHVEEAFIFVVIYYNSKGKMLRKEVYEQDDYERIYCSGKP